jgi:hypothetical protein
MSALISSAAATRVVLCRRLVAKLDHGLRRGRGATASEPSSPGGGVCPTKIPFAGGATFVNEGLGRFTLDGQEGTGIAEHWHNVVE